MENAVSPEFIARLALERWRAQTLDYAKREQVELEILVGAYAKTYDFDQEHLDLACGVARSMAWELVGRVK